MSRHRRRHAFSLNFHATPGSACPTRLARLAPARPGTNEPPCYIPSNNKHCQHRLACMDWHMAVGRARGSLRLCTEKVPSSPSREPPDQRLPCDLRDGPRIWLDSVERARLAKITTAKAQHRQHTLLVPSLLLRSADYGSMTDPYTPAARPARLFARERLSPPALAVLVGQGRGLGISLLGLRNCRGERGGGQTIPAFKRLIPVDDWLERATSRLWSTKSIPTTIFRL